MASESAVPHTFYAFDRPEPAGNTLPLLGRLVANPRRPLDSYRPRRDKANDEAHETKLSNFGVEVAIEPNATISATTIKNMKAGANLGSIFKAQTSMFKNYERRLTSELFRTYKLEQYADVFAEIYNENDQSIVRDFVKASGGHAYMMVALRSAVNPQTEECFADGKSANLGIKVPLAAVTGGYIPINILDPGISLKNSSSREVAAKGIRVGEVVFAAEYCRIVQETHDRFSLGKPTTTTFRASTVAKVSPGLLAFGGDGDSSDEEEDSEQVPNEEMSQDHYI